MRPAAPPRAAGETGVQAGLSRLSRKSLHDTRIPRYAIAVIQALRFSDASLELLESLDDAEWTKLLGFCDPARLTLTLGHYCRASLPDRVRARIDQNYRDNAERFAKLESALLEMADRFTEKNIEFVLLKGSAHAPEFTPDPLLRTVGDIDVWCPFDAVPLARDELLDLRYRPIGASKGRHLPPMARQTDWRWRGDYFATDLPIVVDLHYRLWDEKLERIPPPPENEFWKRRVKGCIEGHLLPVLALPDALAFAALHLLMHILHGDVRLHRAWEIAYFLNARVSDEPFWLEWQQLHPPELRKLQVVVFSLSTEWFGSKLPRLVEVEAQELSHDVKLWIKEYAFSPIEALFVRNKDELLLNLCLVDSFQDRARVFLRRVFPFHAAQLPESAYAGSEPQAASDSAASGPVDPIKFVTARALHHLRTLPITLFQALKWWWIRQGLSRDLGKFLLASALFDFGEFIFFLLYNLYLTDRGFKENLLGQIAGALTTGTFVSILPVGAIIRRIGLRNGLFIAILGTAAATTLRSLVLHPSALVACAFLNGAFMSFWAVLLPTAIAGFTTERNRPLAFSLDTSLGIGIGFLSGLLGGHLPAMLIHAFPFATPAASKRAALLCGSGIAALGIIPAARVKFPPAAPSKVEKKVYPRNRFIFIFLFALFIWNLGTGAFNPFFNVYFAKQVHLSVEHIGLVFSYSQLTQVVVILLAPLVLRRFGEMKSIAGMQIATALMLGLLAVNSRPVAAGFIYVAYMSFQYMSAPGLLTVLMNRVNPDERSGASAMNFLVTALAGIVASTTAGALFPRLGYSPVMLIGAFIAALAALLFYKVVPERVPTGASHENR